MGDKQALPTKRLEHLTFKGNIKKSRYGWLRLTPAYSVHLVSDLLEAHASDPDAKVLDPFCGTGTTALACAERGLPCDTIDINPFSLWLSQVKTRSYSAEDMKDFRAIVAKTAKAIRKGGSRGDMWTPPLHQIEKWWSESTLTSLAIAMTTIKSSEASQRVRDLLLLTFCRTLIDKANVSFGHQSMSFKKNDDGAPMLALDFGEDNTVADAWERESDVVIDGMTTKILSEPSILMCDARTLRSKLNDNTYTCVITSPPYPNRMSYIRELRPYMYWLGYLKDGREAGEMDWQAIGGTWGCATSNVGKWQPPTDDGKVPFDGFNKILDDIKTKSGVLSRYVHKYFYDIKFHCKDLFDVVKPGGTVHYIVGNSKFYDVMLPVEGIYAAMFEDVGFDHVNVKAIRKRTSKKELFEFVVSANKPKRPEKSRSRTVMDCAEASF